MELINILQNRRSVRSYTSEAIAEEKLEKIIQAGLLAPSSRSIRPWELIIVRSKDTLIKMSDCRVGAAKMLAGADAAIVVLAKNDASDVWVEDSSIVMTTMHIMADSLGVGSCWIQGRLRNAPGGESTEDYLRALLNYPKEFSLEAILSLGMPAEKGEGYKLEELPTEKVHREKY